MDEGSTAGSLSVAASPSSRDASTKQLFVDDGTPVTRRRRLSFVSRPVALTADETVPATHRSRRFQTAHRPIPQPEDRMGFFASSALAIVSLLFVSAVALGSMLGSTALLHLISPDRRFDTFRALHEPLVVGLLFGLAVLWLLPPHPWAVRPARTERKSRRLFRAKAAL